MSERKSNADVASRRHLLKLGAMAAPAVITLAPASARAAASVLHCHVPMPEGVTALGEPCTPTDSAYGQQATASSGTSSAMAQGNDQGPPAGQTTAQTGEICYAAPENRALTGQQIQNGFGIEGMSAEPGQYDAYVAYLNRVKQENGTGVSCLMSVNLAQR